MRAGLRVLRRPPRGLVLLLVALAVEAVYVFIVSAGRLTDWPTYLTFLNDQAEGFRGGHLHLAVEPLPALLARPNPFDPVNRPLWYWDASLYKSHYYLYWGPVPALLLAAAKVVFRIKTEVGDQIPVFALATLQLGAGTLLLHRIARRLFERLPTVLVATGVVAFGLANPTLYNLARGGVYEAAIVGGHAFLVSGLLFAFGAVWNGDSDRNRRRGLVGAGVCWALALGCRVTVAPAVALLVLTTAMFAGGSGERRWRRRISSLLWGGMPVALVLILLLAYNKVRFDDWLDFGRHYQLSWISFGAKLAYVPANLYSYGLRPLVRSCRFPFLFAPEGMGEPAFPKGYHLPDGYFVGEQVVGFLVAMPWSWLAMVAGVALARSFWRGWRQKREVDVRTRTTSWAIASLAIVALGTLAVALPLLSATMRYLGDSAGGMALSATLGAWLLYEKVRRRVMLRRLVVAGSLCLMLATAGAGIALGFEGQYKHFRASNPRLLDRLEARWSVCGRRG